MFKVCVCAFVHACMCECVSVCVLPNVNNDIMVFLPTDSMEIHGLRQIVLETHFPGAFQRRAIRKISHCFDCLIAIKNKPIVLSFCVWISLGRI